MNRGQRWLLWVAVAASTATGLAYAAMRYLMEGDDPFSAYHHPLQPWALDAHVIGTPLLVFACGWLWGTHVVPKLRRRGAEARASGFALLGLAALMILSGYALQTLADELWRAATAWLHGVSGTLFAAVAVGHALVGRAPAARPRARP